MNPLLNFCTCVFIIELRSCFVTSFVAAAPPPAEVPAPGSSKASSPYASYDSSYSSSPSIETSGGGGADAAPTADGSIFTICGVVTSMSPSSSGGGSGGFRSGLGGIILGRLLGSPPPPEFGGGANRLVGRGLVSGSPASSPRGIWRLSATARKSLSSSCARLTLPL